MATRASGHNGYVSTVRSRSTALRREPGAPTDPAPAAWFLAPGERANRATALDRAPTWSTGNTVTVHIDGADYFRRLTDIVRAAQWPDAIALTDWEGNRDERLAAGTPLDALLLAAVRRGVALRGLVWRSHPRQAHFAEQDNAALARRARRSRRRGPARRTGPAGRQPSPEAGHRRPLRRPRRSRRVRRWHRPLPRSARRPRPPRRPTVGRARPSVRRPPTVARRAGGDPWPGGRRSRRDLPRAVGRPDAARPSQSPARARAPLGAPTRRPQGAVPPIHPAGRVRHRRGSGAAHLPGEAPALSVRPRRRAQHRARRTSRRSGGRVAWSTWRTSTCGRPPPPVPSPTRCGGHPCCA